MLGSFSLGYFISMIPGGMLAQYFGGRIVVGIVLLSSGILTAFTPLAATSYPAVYALRATIGAFCVGFTFARGFSHCIFMFFLQGSAVPGIA